MDWKRPSASACRSPCSGSTNWPRSIPGRIWIGEGFASNSLISGPAYRRFVTPYQRAVVERILRRRQAVDLAYLR